MAGEGDKRKKLLLKEFREGPKTLEYLIGKYNVKESSVKHDVIALKRQGFRIEGTPKKGWFIEQGGGSGSGEASTAAGGESSTATGGGVSKDNDDDKLFESSYKRDGARLVVLLILQRSDRPLDAREISKQYMEYSYLEEEEVRHVQERLEKYILPKLVTEGMVVRDANGSYTVSKEAPVYLTLSEEDTLDIIEQIETFGKTHPFSDQLDGISKKLQLAFYNDEGTPAADRFEVLGRYYKRSSEIEEIYRKIEDIPYERYTVNITYKDKLGEVSSFPFNTGLVTYVADKDQMYMIGRRVGKDEDFVMTVERIQDIEVTDKPNNIYASVHYMDMFYDMFSISTEEPERVKIRFRDSFNIMDKLRSKFKYRTKYTLTKMDGYIYYEDEIRGASDLAKLLRSFGSSLEVIEPESLRKRMRDSAARSIERYRREGMV